MANREALRLCRCESRPRPRMEVFSAVMRLNEGVNSYWFKQYCGVVLLHSCNRDFVIFDAEALEPPQVNSEGHVNLTGPRLSIPVEDEVVICPWFINLELCTQKILRTTLWKAKSDEMDQFICRKIMIIYRNYLDVSFAVYRDAVEAHLDVYLVDFDHAGEDALIQVHGSVSASNSFLSDSRAKSFLFHKLSDERVSLRPGKSVPLTLSRRMTVVPRQSTLLVHVSIAVGPEHGNQLIIDDTVKFNRSLDSAEEFIALPYHGKVLVKVNWVDCQDIVEQ